VQLVPFKDAAVDRASAPKQAPQKEKVHAGRDPKRQLLESSAARATGTQGRPPRSPTSPAAASPNIIKSLGVCTRFEATVIFVKHLDQYKTQHVMPSVYLFLCIVLVYLFEINYEYTFQIQ